MNMIWNRFLILAGCLYLLVGCAKPAPEYTSYAKPEVDFEQFHSFYWKESRPETAAMHDTDDFIHRLIVQTVEEELNADGLAKAESGDLSIGYRLTVSPQKSFWQSLYRADSVNPGTYNQRAAEAQKSSVDERTSSKGVLVIEMHDTKGKLVWSGRGSIVFSRSQPSLAVVVVRKIMANYPPVE